MRVGWHSAVAVVAAVAVLRPAHAQQLDSGPFSDDFPRRRLPLAATPIRGGESLLPSPRIRLPPRQGFLQGGSRRSGTGGLPLDPRPAFDNPNFKPRVEVDRQPDSGVPPGQVTFTSLFPDGDEQEFNSFFTVRKDTDSVPLPSEVLAAPPLELEGLEAPLGGGGENSVSESRNQKVEVVLPVSHEPSAEPEPEPLEEQATEEHHQAEEEHEQWEASGQQHPPLHPQQHDAGAKEQELQQNPGEALQETHQFPLPESHQPSQSSLLENHRLEPLSQPQDFRPLEPEQHHRTQESEFSRPEPGQESPRPFEPEFQPRDPDYKPREPQQEPRPFESDFRPREPDQEPKPFKVEFQPRDPGFRPIEPNQEPKPFKPEFRPREPDVRPKEPEQEPKPFEPQFQPRDPGFRPIETKGGSLRGTPGPLEQDFIPLVPGQELQGTVRPRRQQQGTPQQFKQATHEIREVVSVPHPQRRPSVAPPPPVRTPAPFVSTHPPRHRPQHHPNLLPLYQVDYTEEMEVAESREQPSFHSFYDYDEEEVGDLEEEEEEEPDRLSVLLLQSGFSCVDKKNGYYADEEVDCEVFHYCQDRVKHSWLCPQGASFHQVHLICMPRSEDNICERSSKFHFVNEFLYKEVDDGHPNKTYANRYYPEGFEDGVADSPDGDVYVGDVQPLAQPLQPSFQRPQHRPRRPQPTARPQQPFLHPQPQRQYFQEETVVVEDEAAFIDRKQEDDTRPVLISQPEFARPPPHLQQQPQQEFGFSRPPPQPQREFSKPLQQPQQEFSRPPPQPQPEFSRPRPQPQPEFSRPPPQPQTEFSRPPPQPQPELSRPPSQPEYRPGSVFQASPPRQQQQPQFARPAPHQFARPPAHQRGSPRPSFRGT